MEYKKSINTLCYEWWKNIDKFIFSLIILLFGTGLFFSLVSTSLLVSDKLETNDYTFFFKHLSFVLLGIIIIFILSSINKEKLFKISPLIFFLSLISLFLVPIVGVEVNSAQRWIDLYFLPRFQPIELVKPFLIILLFVTGLFFSLVSTSLLVSDKLNTNDYTFFFKHLSFVVLGIIIIFLLSVINE